MAIAFFPKFHPLPFNPAGKNGVVVLAGEGGGGFGKKGYCHFLGS